MKLRLLTLRTFFLMIILLSVGIANLCADTVSLPVSVAIPAGGSGEINASPVSVVIPAPTAGEVDSRPVSVIIPAPTAGQIDSLPASVSIRSANLSDPDLVGLWHMDGDWFDASGNGNNGLPYNGVTFSGTKIAGTSSGSFNGTNNYLNIKSAAIIANLPQSSVEAWIYPTSVSCVSGSDARTIYSENVSGGTVFFLSISCSGNPVFGIWRTDVTGNWATVTSSSVLTPNNWYHVVGTLDASGMKVYVNNLPSDTNPANRASNGSISEIDMGRINNSGGRNYFSGLIDELTVYKRALTAEEIAVHYAAGVSDPTAPPAPVLDTVPSFVGTNSLSLSGTRPANTSIWVNNKKVAALDSATTWQGSYATLQPGVNILNVAALDAANRLSPQVSKTVFYDIVPPIIASSSPVSGSNTTKAVNSVTINLYDANAGVDATGSIQNATVKNAANQPIAGSWTTSGTNTIIFTPNAPFPADIYTVAVLPVDTVGNRQAQPQQVVFTNRDTSAPATKATLAGTKDSVGWYSTSVTVTLAVTDGGDGSGVAKTEYSLDNVTWQQYSAPFVVDRDGRSTVYFKSTDNTGNVESPAKSQEILINKTGLVGLWHMDGNWNDASVVGNNGTPNGGVSFSPIAKIGTQSGSFDGVNDYVQIPNNATLNPEKISVELWAKSNTATWNNHGFLASKRDAYILHPLQGSKEIRFYGFIDGTWQYVSYNDPNLDITKWHHYVGTYDGVTLNVYVDGIKSSVLYAGSINTTDTGALYLGWDDGQSGRYLNGLLDEVAIYSRVLSDQEIQQHYRDFVVASPTVNPVTTPTKIADITLSGTKPASTAIVVNGNTLVPLDGSTTWQAPFTLSQGTNNLSITALDSQSFNSLPVTLSVVLDLTPPQITATIPQNNGILKTVPAAITFNLADAFSTLDLAATLNGATVTSAGLNVAGSWNSSGTGTSGTVAFIPTAALTDGVYIATVKPTDSLANGTTSSISFTIDTTPPPAPGIDPITAPINTTSKTVTGTKSSDSASVVVSCAGATVGAVSYPTATTWSVTVSGLKEGSNTVTAFAVDSAGNPSGSAATTVTVDTLPPGKPVITASVSPTKISSVTLSGTKEANSYLYVNSLVTGASFADTNWSYPANLSEGSNPFNFFAKDAAGNQSPTASVTLVRDTTPPTLSSATGVTNGSGAITVILADGVSGSGVNLNASLAGVVVKKNNIPVAEAGTWTVVGNALVFNPSSQLADGVYTVTINPTDTIGNSGTASFSFTLDRTPPTVQLQPSQSPFKAGSVTFTLNFSEAMDTTQPAVTFTRGFLYSTYTLNGSWTNPTTWLGSYPFTAGTGDGTYTVTIKGAKDVAGNVMADQEAGSFTLDTTAPAAPTVAAVTTPTRIASQTISGTKPADTALVINNAVRVPLNSATTWTYSYPLAEGANALTIVARDAAGNDSLPIAPAPAIKLDTTPPLFSVDTYKSPSPTVTQTIDGKKEPGCIVTLNGVTIFDAAEQNATWSYPVTLTDGISNHLVFTAADALGNTATKTLDILCDTAPPSSLAAGMLVADGSGKGTEVSLSWPSYVETSGLGYYRVYTGTADYTSVTGLTPTATVNKGTRSFKAGGLTQGSRYWFAVVPVSVSGNADAAVHTAQGVPTDTVAPEEVTGLAAWAGYSAADGNTVTLSWTPSSNTAGDLADQLVYMDAGQGYDAGSAISKTVATFTKKGLNDATNYKFKVTTKDTLGHESAGSVVTAETRLANPAGVMAVPGNQKVTLSWSAVSSPYVKLYNIYRLQSDTQQTDVGAMTLVKSQSGTTFTDTTGIANGVTYQYAVTTLNTYGAERTSVQSVSATPRGDTTGPVISNVNIAPNQVITAPMTISASAVDANDSTGHPESAMGRIELWIDGVQTAAQNGGTLSYSWNVVNATDGNHAVRIAAYDAPGNLTEQAFPVVVSLAPPVAPVISSTFGAPINLQTATISGTAQQGATVSLRVNGVVVAQVTATDAAFTFPAVVLAEGVNSVAAKASNRGGDSPFSADTKITVVTAAPAAPLNLVAKPLAGGSIQFSWQAGGSGAVGYNLYEGTASLSGISEAGVHKTNSTPIPYLLKEYIPADDTPRFYTVTAIDGAGNESPVSNVVSIAADRAAPTASDVQFTQNSTLITQNSAVGPGQVQVALTVSEALSETPFLSLEPQIGSPIVVSLRKSDDTHYTGSITLDATSPHGPTTWKFSGKDLVGNRGNGSGAGPALDVRGPQASITAPLILLKTTTGPVSVALVLDEPSTTTPALTLKASDGGTAQVAGLASTDSGLNWSGTLDPSALAEGSAQFLLSGTRDRFGNIGTTVKTGGSILLYKTTPPASAVPSGLTAKPGKGGTVALSWTKVADAQGYNVYRQGTGDSAPIHINTISTGTTVTFSDIPAVDGSYNYSVSSLGLLGVESVKSGQVTAVSDRTSPPVPTGLALTLSGNGVQATWEAVAAPAEIPASYRLYRSGSVITDITGLTPLITVKSTSATDSSPTKVLRFYAVTSLDALGNESLPVAAPEITFPVAPVGNLTLTLVDDGKPSLSWVSGEANVQGFYIYRNGSKINQTPTISTTYSDGYYSSGSVTYGVSAVDANGIESPVKEVTLPALTIGLKDGTTMHRGVLETIALLASVPADAASSLNIDAVTVKIGTLPESIENGPFTVISGTPLEIKKVAATEANAPPQEAVVVTAVMHPAPGTTIKLTKSSLVSVLGSGTTLEIFNEPLVRGTTASVRIKVNNLGSARSEFLTSENGGPTSHVKVNLRDQDGNLLAQGSMDQRTGAVINFGSYAVARLDLGESFLSEPITFAVPATAPYKVSIEVLIDNMYYHYGQDDRVVAPGLKQSLDGNIADVSYIALATTDKEVYKQGESVQITGQTISTTTATPMPFVPVKIGVTVKGFDRFFTVNTDQVGAFSYTFTPAANEAGRYSIWASHPDLADRSIQTQFSIIGLSVTPSVANVTILKGGYVDIPVMLQNLGGSPLTVLKLIPTASSGITASVLNPGADTIAAGETRSVTFRTAAAGNSSDSGFATLAISTNEGLNGEVAANISMVSPIPLITTTPSYIDTGLMRGSQRIESFTIANTGYNTLMNPRIEGPSLTWLSLAIDKNIGECLDGGCATRGIRAGQSKAVGIVINPADTIAQGVYNDRLVIYADNHIPYTYNIQVTVTSSAIGNVRFRLVDQLMDRDGAYPPIAGGAITLQNQSLPELLFTLTTAADGTVSLTDIPEGRYSYNVSVTGHKPYSDSFVIIPGVWTTVPVALEVNLVQVEWSVTPTTIQDQYQVTINQTFETNVPAPVLVAEPPGISVPKLTPGQVFNGEFTITNYGLIAVEDIQVNFPKSYLDYDIEILGGTIPDRIEAKQTLRISYRITRRLITASAANLLVNELPCYGGDCIDPLRWEIGGTCLICPHTAFERRVRSVVSWILSFFRDCPGGASAGVPPTSSTTGVFDGPILGYTVVVGTGGTPPGSVASLLPDGGSGGGSCVRPPAPCIGVGCAPGWPPDDPRDPDVRGPRDPRGPDDPDRRDPRGPDDPDRRDPRGPDDPDRRDPRGPDDPSPRVPRGPDGPDPRDPGVPGGPFGPTTDPCSKP
jgi:hypothetical protein